MEINNAIISFDKQYTSNEIQLLKLCLPFLAEPFHPYAAAYIKIRELQICLNCLQKVDMRNFSLQMDYLDLFLKQAGPFCNEDQREKLNYFSNLRKQMDMIEKLGPIINQNFDLNSIIKDAENDSDSNASQSSTQNDMGQILSWMAARKNGQLLNEKQQKMYEKFKQDFQNMSKEATSESNRMDS